jgi:hypothetical protein
VELAALYQDGPVSYAPLDRALVDAARQLTDLPYIRELVASAVQRGKILVAHLVRELDAGSAAGSARMRLVLGEVAAGVRSTAEADLRTLIIQGQLPTPLYNHDLYVAGQFLARPDAWWPDAAVAAEVDSKAWHLLPADYEQTLERHDRMIAQGIRVLLFRRAACVLRSERSLSRSGRRWPNPLARLRKSRQGVRAERAASPRNGSMPAQQSQQA